MCAVCFPVPVCCLSGPGLLLRGGRHDIVLRLQASAPTWTNCHFSVMDRPDHKSPPPGEREVGSSCFFVCFFKNVFTRLRKTDQWLESSTFSPPPTVLLLLNSFVFNQERKTPNIKDGSVCFRGSQRGREHLSFLHNEAIAGCRDLGTWDSHSSLFRRGLKDQ